MGVVVGNDGVLYVFDRKAGKVFAVTDSKVETLPGRLNGPVGLAFDLEGWLLIVEEKAGRLVRLGEGGQVDILQEIMKAPR